LFAFGYFAGFQIYQPFEQGKSKMSQDVHNKSHEQAKEKETIAMVLSKIY
jgi:hypothetical protein